MDTTQLVTMADVTRLTGRVRWLWPGWIPRGSVTLLAGAPGVGKSMLSLAISKSVVEGQPWPDGVPLNLPPSNVVWCDTEWAQAITAERIQNWRLPAERFIVPSSDDPLASIQLNLKSDRDRLMESVRIAKPELVVVDSLNAAHGRDQNKAQDMRPIMEFLARDLARAYDIGVIATAHLRKKFPQEELELTVERISGSIGVPYLSRVVSGLEFIQGILRYRVIKTNFGIPPEPLSMVIGEDDVYFEEAPDLLMSRLDKAIQFLGQTLSNGPVRYSDFIRLAQSQGISKRQLYKAQRVLGIQSTKDGWRLEQEGIL